MAKITDDSFNKLKNLVSLFEENEMELTDAPQELVDIFGYSCLANSLMFKEPEIPKYDEKTIFQYINTHTFSTVASLCNYIISIKNDIDKLYAIFCWAALNIQYDVDSFFSNNIHSTTLEEVFNTKKAVCAGYEIFFEEMAKRTKINTKRIKIHEYSNFAKAYGYDPLNPPICAKSDHASVYIEIDGIQFISEPTWGAGSINKNNKFEQKFNPRYFLIPIYKTLNDHYPCDESAKLLKLNFPFKDFLKSIEIRQNTNIKTESHPFVNFESKNGFIKQIYSCNGPIDSISFNIFLKTNDRFIEIPSEGIIGYQILQKKIPKHPERCRFQVNISFPQNGLFKIEMFINHFIELEFYVRNLSKSSIPIPINYNPWNEPKFIPILPKTILTKIDSNYAIIRFAVSPKRSKLLWKIYKLNNVNSFDKNGQKINEKNGTYATLTIPFDNERYEDQLCINFPSNGRYAVDIYLSNDEGTFTLFITYYFDVFGANNKNIETKNILNFIFKERSFLPAKFFYGLNNELSIRPNVEEMIVTEEKQFIDIKTDSENDIISLNLRKNGKTYYPKKIGETTDQYQRFEFTLNNGYGEYNLLGWINDSEHASIDIKYMYTDEIPNATREELSILNDLKKFIEKEKAEDKYNKTSNINKNKQKDIKRNEEKEFNTNNKNKKVNDTSNISKEKNKIDQKYKKENDNNDKKLHKNKEINDIKDKKDLPTNIIPDKPKLDNQPIVKSTKNNNNEIDSCKEIISILNFDPNHPVPINDPYSIDALQYLKIQIDDITYPNDTFVEIFSNDPIRKLKVRSRLQKCVNIMINCVKKEREKIIKMQQNDINADDKKYETDKYLSKIIEVKDYIKKMETYEQNKIKQKENTHNQIDNETINIDDDDKPVKKDIKDEKIKNHNDQKQHPKNNFQCLQTVNNNKKDNQDLKAIIDKNREIIVQNELYLNENLIKYIQKANKKILISKKRQSIVNNKNSNNLFKRPVSILSKKKSNQECMQICQIHRRSKSAFTLKTNK